MIASVLEEYLATSREHESSGKKKKFYLSDMGKCMRMRWFKRKGVEAEYDPFVNWIFAMGDLIHDFGYRALEAKGVLLEAESCVENDDFIGRYDGLVKNGAKKSPFDFKSAGSFKMSKVMKGDDDEENISQVLSYAYLLRQSRKDISDSSFVVYVNKEPSEKVPTIFFEREYHLTTWRIKQLEEEMAKITDYWQKEKVPPCSCPSWMKDYNSYQPLCGASDKEIDKYLALLKAGKRLISTKKALYLVDGDSRKELKKL